MKPADIPPEDTEDRLIHIEEMLELLTVQTAELHRLATLKTEAPSARARPPKARGTRRHAPKRR
jgi:hypothetical protein